jgi:peptidyl-prolyl cis-trans isomerase B (cyclophilin B)
MKNNKGNVLVIFTALAAAFVILGGVFYIYRGKGNNASPSQNQSDKKTYAIIETSLGDIELELFSADAPRTVENFIKLAEQGFYNYTKFHRVIKGFMIQAGDPNSRDKNWADDGMGGPGYTFADEINQHKIVKGVIAMANAGPNTNGSQFFILTAENANWLDGKHAVFGKVIGPMDAVSAIENMEVDKNDHPLEDAVIFSVDIIRK